MANFKYYTHPDTGEKHIRVSSVLAQLNKPALVQWAANCAADYIQQQWDKDKEIILATRPQCAVDKWVAMHTERAKRNFRSVSRAALDVGTAVHEAIEEYLKVGVKRKMDSKQAQAGFDAFFKWMDSFGISRDNTVHTERTVYGSWVSDTGSYRYAGTYDWLVEKGGELWLVDFKTSKGFYEEMPYQLAAYKNGERDNIQHCAVLRLDKNTGKPHFREYENFSHALSVFGTLLELYYLRYEAGKNNE
jgi:hypothetical protein